MDRISQHRFAAVLLLYFASGFTALIYEVLWMKELSLLFGNTAQAAATTLAAFFAGMAAGSSVWGRRSGGLERPLRTYALLEAGVAASALLYFLLLGLYHAVYPALYDNFHGQRPVFLAAKLLMAFGILFPPSFFMGGTFPVMTQYVVRRIETLGYHASSLYTLNTLGAAFGAYVAGFYLPPLLGFELSYLTAVLLTFSIALTAWVLSAGGEPPVSSAGEGGGTTLSAAGIKVLPLSDIRLLAFISGFATLCLEVLWTRMFAQVLQNSVYTFSAILVTFLFALALGGALAGNLIRRGVSGPRILYAIMLAGAALTALGPFLFVRYTDGLSFIGQFENFGSYILVVFAAAFLFIIPPAALLGTVFPYLFRVSESHKRGSGRTVGILAAINTVGAILGSLAAGFVLLDTVGLWASILLVSALYLAAACVFPMRGSLHRGALLPPLAGALVLGFFLDTSHLPLVWIDREGKGEFLLEVWEGSGGTVSVVGQGQGLGLKVNNYYTLGGTPLKHVEELQAHLPLLIHPEPRNAFFLGMGTGITAGASLRHPLERVVVAELVPDAVTAARKYFRPYVHGLFEDTRVDLVVEDGRNHLMGTSEKFDVIVADLFMPWKAGTGTLYSREHYRKAAEKLAPGGIYAQWLPLYQISAEDFCVVARTMLGVFPQVTAWWGLVNIENPVLLLAGSVDPFTLEGKAIAGSRPGAAALLAEFFPGGNLLSLYFGNLSTGAEALPQCSVNTDDRPVIEYSAPISNRLERSGHISMFNRILLLDFYDALRNSLPEGGDPFLADLEPLEREAAGAGRAAYRARLIEAYGSLEAAREALSELGL